MFIEGKFSLNVPIQKAWENLLNPKTLCACVPGCEKLEVIDERTYDCVIKQKVGPVAVKFKFLTTLDEVNSPTHLKASGSGADMGKAGSFKHEMIVDLAEVSAAEVEVSYHVNVTIVGRLATFGDRIMRAKAKDVEQQLTKNLQEKLQTA